MKSVPSMYGRSANDTPVAATGSAIALSRPIQKGRRAIRRWSSGNGSPVYINVVPDGVGRQNDECWIRVPYRHATLDDDSRRVLLSDVATLDLGTATAGLAFIRGSVS
jgi:hypothetical protein